jgi:predicted metal-dependent hydrolase
MRLQVGDIDVEVLRKKIKNVHLSVHPPAGRVRMAVPECTNMETVRVFAISKLPWIRKQQQNLREQERETPREYLDRESHYVWGRRCLLKIEEVDATPSIEFSHGRLILRMRAGTSAARRQAIIDQWYREQLHEAVPALLEVWQRMIGVRARGYFVQRMKTKWGGCNARAGTIRLNTDLARKPRQCLEYIVVHELVHLLEPTHNDRFKSLMDQFLPKWRYRRDLLNALPLRHEHWD